MKTVIRKSPESVLRHTSLAAGATLLATLLAIPVNAAVSTSFPQHPLQVGTTSVPPNILFILDDSGSMNFVSMGTVVGDVSDPDDGNYGVRRGLGDNPTDRSYVNNTIYYDPRKTYRPWRTSSTGLDDRLTNASITAASSHVTLLTGQRNLAGHQDGIFYVPNPGVADPGTTPSNYTKYRIASMSGQARVVRVGETVVSVGSWSVPTIQAASCVWRLWWVCDYSSRDVSVSVPSGYETLVISLSGGTGDGGIELLEPNGNRLCSANTTGNNESCQATISGGGNYTVRITNYSRSNQLSGATLRAEVKGNFIEERPTGRSQDAEVQNYANWYQYHRTRMKVAKAGASEAFGTLDDAYRVGFDTIWNKPGYSNGHSANTLGRAPSFPIPLDAATRGAFSGTNRSNWFRHLQEASATGDTPLHGALQRAGRYYKTADPWKDHAGGEEISCRQSYAILTTDGFWNNSSGYSSSDPKSADGFGPAITVGDNDGDDVVQTLADVAMAYYDVDLRTNLGNNVPTSTRDSNPRQHMVTFGVSIGLEGTLRQDTTPASGSSAWPNPWRTSGTFRDTSIPSGGWGDASARRIDDLWHAAVNSKGEFIVANDSEAFANALKRALSQIASRRASGGNIASNGPELTTGSRSYQAIFTTGSWSGDLIAYDISSSVMGQTEVQWRLSESVNNPAKNFASRTILTHGATGGQAFTYNNLSDTQKAALTRASGQVGVVAVSGQNNFNYLIGQRGLEIGRDGTPTETNYLRRRDNPIGDIINSAPFYEMDTGMLYVGANDGMLHGVTSAGDVAFSYVPAGISFTELGKLSDPKYGEAMANHRFFVDGKIDVSTRKQEANADPLIEDGDQNILVAALGRGGKGVFALDVTAPEAMTATKVLWDRSFQPGAAGSDDDMGYVLGQVLARKGEGGQNLVIVPNGLDSVSGEAVMFVYLPNHDGTLPQTGGVVKLRTGAGSSGARNGLMNIGVGDLDGNGKIDTLYGGDMQGNLWRWDISSTNSADWAGTRHLMFVAKDSNNVVQPITGGISLAREPNTRRIFVSFGTGKYIYENDVPSNTSLDTEQVQTLYTLIDDAAYLKTEAGVTKTTLAKSDLQLREFKTFGSDSIDRDARAAEAFSALPSGKKGWYLNLGVPDSARGERIVSTPVVYGRALWFTSLIPRRGSGCNEDGTRGYLNAIDVFTGTNPSSDGTAAGTYTFIDVNANEKGDDRLKGTGDGAAAGSRFITSVDVGLGGLGNLRMTNGNVCVGGFNADGTCIPTTPPLLGDQAKRIMWRELVRN